jgi:Endodeoxyribonuclease RusA
VITYRCWAFAINPEPWAMGDTVILRNRKTGKHFPKFTNDKTMDAYQQALREELRGRGVRVEPGYYAFRFTLSRQLEKSYTATSTLTRNVADVTNMQKATEDALQGVAIGNDRAVVSASARLAEIQSEHTVPYILIELVSGIEDWDPWGDELFPRGLGTEAREQVLDAIEEYKNPVIHNNEWTP